MSYNLTEYKDKTDFPFGEVNNTRWFLAILLMYGSFIFASVNTVMPVLTYIFFMVSAFVSLFILDIKWYKKLLRPLRGKDLLVIIAVLLLLFGGIVALSNLLSNMQLEENPIIDTITADNYIRIALVSLIQLFVEELLFVVIFLFSYHKLRKINSTFALIAAWIISSLVFGALHLPTYNFNVIQSLVLIGFVRFILSLAYIIRKNLLNSYLVHVLYDFIIIALAIYANTVL